MYKVIIVDDEPSARFGIRDCLPWEQFGIEVIGVADDGEEALSLISKTQPHIVITDVKMPGMDGIALSSKLKSLYNNIKIIFISGYDDVEYLKSALKVSAVDYILKPINLGELKLVIEKVMKTIKGEEAKKQLINRMETSLNQSLPLLKDKFLVTLVRDGIYNETTAKKKMAFLGIDLPIRGFFSLFMISIDDHFFLFDRLSERNRQLNSFALLNICQEIIDKYVRGYAFETQQGEFVCLLSLISEEDEEKLFLLINEIKDELSRILKLSVTIGVSRTVNEMKEIPRAYSIALEAVNQKLFLGKNQIIMMDSLESGKKNLFKLDLKKGEKFASILKAADKQKLLEFVDDIFADLAHTDHINIKHCQNVCLQLLLTGSSLLLELEIHKEDLAEYEHSLLDRLFKLETIEDMKSQLSSYFLRVIFFIQEKRSHKSKYVIEQIKSIILQNFNNDLTIKDIAEQVYLTSTYLCMIFKQETRETINEYITKIRMEKATEMLAEPGNKLYDVCYAIGFKDPSYFSKLFKKHTGLTPTEYREKIL